MLQYLMLEPPSWIRRRRGPRRRCGCRRARSRRSTCTARGAGGSQGGFCSARPTVAGCWHRKPPADAAAAGLRLCSRRTRGSSAGAAAAAAASLRQPLFSSSVPAGHAHLQPPLPSVLLPQNGAHLLLTKINPIQFQKRAGGTTCTSHGLLAVSFEYQVYVFWC